MEIILSIDWKLILVLSCLLFSFLIFILQCVLLGRKPYYDGVFKELHTNWKKSPILDIIKVEDNDINNYNQNELITFKNTKLYIKRMKSKFTFPYLMVRSKNISINSRTCIDYNNITINFPYYEPCPITKIWIGEINDSYNNFTNYIELKNKQLLFFSNQANVDTIYNDFDENFNSNEQYQYIKITNKSHIPDDFENILNVKEKEIVKNYISLFITFFLFPYIIDIKKFTDEKYYISEVVKDFPFTYFLFPLTPLLISYSVGVYWSNNILKILTQVEFQKNNDKYRDSINTIHNLESCNLSFCIIFFLFFITYIIVKIVKYYQVKNNPNFTRNNIISEGNKIINENENDNLNENQNINNNNEIDNASKNRSQKNLLQLKDNLHSSSEEDKISSSEINNKNTEDTSSLSNLENKLTERIDSQEEIYILKRTEEMILIIYLKVVSILAGISIILIPFIFISINIHEDPFNESLFRDLKLNYKMSPIVDIQITYSLETKNINPSYFNNLVPYKLGKIEKKNEEPIDLTIWKKKQFYITRMKKRYTYPKIKGFKNNKNTKQCGKVNNISLYFPSNEPCPINYIKITNSKLPPLNNIRFISKQIDKDTYLHYTNEYIEGSILVDLQISSSDNPIGDENTYNSICYSLYSKSKCKLDNEYIGNNTIYGFGEIDNTSDPKDIGINDNIIENKVFKLFSRTYAGIKEDNNIYLGNYIFNIHSLVLGTHITSLIFYFPLFILITLMFIYYNNPEKDRLTFYFSFSIFVISFITLILNSLTIDYVQKVRKKILNPSDLDVRENYINVPTFIKYDFVVVIFSIIFLILGLIFSIKAYRENKSCFTYTFKNSIEKFLFRTEYIPQKIFILIIIFTIIILFPSLLLSHNLYNEGYIDTIIENWKKSPITDIEIIDNDNEKTGEKIGNLMNKNFYFWKGRRFKFKRNPGKYYYNKILQNKKNKNRKKCGKDNVDNELYFLGNESCPINDIIIDQKDNYKNYRSIQINDDYYLHYSNNNTSGKILIDLKVSDIKGPCLNKKKNNNLCLFYFDKCNLSYKDYMCDAYKTDNGFLNKKEIDKIFFSDFLSDNHINDSDNYDNTSEIYLYHETYIGVEKLYNEKNFATIYSIKKFSKNKNIVLFFSMFIFIICLIIFIYSYQKGKNTILSFVCLVIFIFSIICFLLSFTSIIIYSIYSKNILKCFPNELTDYYKKFVWQEVIEIFNMIFYLAFSISSFILLKQYLIEDEYFLFKKIKCNIPSISQIIRLRRKNIISYFIISFFIFSIIPFILSVLLLYIEDFNDGYIKDIKDNWKKSPIQKITNEKSEFNFGIFHGVKDDTYSDNNTKINLIKFNNYTISIVRYENNKYNYPFFINNKEENKKKCGIDSEGNAIFFPNSVPCPLNFIEIKHDKECKNGTNNITLGNILKKNIFLCYSNESVNNKIIVDFKISTMTEKCTNAKFDNDICQHFNYTECVGIKDKNCQEEKNVTDYFEIDKSNLNSLFEDNNISINEAVYNNTKEVYLYYRTYKGFNRKEVEDISKTKSLLKSLLNIKNFGKGKNVYLLIIHLIFIIFLCFKFYFFDEEEKRFEKYFYGFSLFMVICLIINISLCSQILRSKNLFKNHIFKYLGETRYKNFKTIFNYEKLNMSILIFDLILMSLIIFWTHYYYTHKITHVPKRWGLIRIMKKPRNIIIFFNFVFTFIIIILICILLNKGEYSDIFYKSLEKNWKKSPIYSINSPGDYIFHTFHGTKNKAYGESVNEKKILKWYSTIKVERTNNKGEKKIYTDFFKGGTKSCGFDSEGNQMIVPNEEDCPVNGIEINNNNTFKYDKNISLGDNYYIFYTNSETYNKSRKILVDFKISDINPSINIDTDNAICTLINDNCNLDSKKLIYNLTNEEKKIYDNLNSMELFKLLVNNDINISLNSFNLSQKISIYSETYIGKKNSTKYILRMRRFSRDKNIVLLFFTLLFFLFLFIYFEFIPYKYGYYGLCIFLLVNFLLFINFILSIVSVALYYDVTKNVLTQFDNLMKKEYESIKWHCKINFILIFLFLIDLSLGILNYKALFKFNIISTKKEFERKYDVNYNEPRIYQPDIPTKKDNINENNKKQLLIEELKNLKNFEKILLTEIENIKKQQNSEEFEKIKNDKKYLEDEIETLNKNIIQLRKEKKKLDEKTEQYKKEYDDYINYYNKELQEINDQIKNYDNQIKLKENENKEIEKKYIQKIEKLKEDKEKITKKIYQLREERAKKKKIILK